MSAEGSSYQDAPEPKKQKTSINVDKHTDAAKNESSPNTSGQCDDIKTEPLTNYKVFNDPIHGHIELHPLCVKIIDTPEFQRLRYIKQLGACSFVYPGAAHNRFEHSLGVCHLAGKMTRQLQQLQPDRNIQHRDVLCLEIAGLCHDLGHGPFSHLFDNKFMKKQNKTWQHEEGSQKMLNYMLNKEDGALKKSFKDYGLTDDDIEFITHIITVSKEDMEKPDWRCKGRRPQSKRFLYEIVANKRNGVDVDKWDYFARDCYNLGITNSFDHNRCIKFARIIDVEVEQSDNSEKSDPPSTQSQICFRDKEVYNLYDMFHTRYSLHKRAYQHKTCNIIEYMFSEALEKADKYIKFVGEDEKRRRMSECCDDMKAYSQLTDNVISIIMNDPNPKLKESQDILTKIFQRRLYRYLGRTTVELKQEDIAEQLKDIAEQLEDKQTAENLKKIANTEPLQTKDIDVELTAKDILKKLKENPKDRACEIEEDDIIILIVKLDYGMKTKNPIDEIHFYSKDNLDKAKKIRQKEVSLLLPKKFGEKQILAFCKSEDTEIQNAVAEAFKQWCEEKKLPAPKTSMFTPLHQGNSVTPDSQERDSVCKNLSAQM